MIKQMIFLFFILFGQTLQAKQSDVQPVDATWLMDKVNQRYVGDDAYSELTFEYVSSSGNEKIMKFDLWNLETQEGNKTLLKYIMPQFMKGSGVLIHSFDHDQNLQWLYLSRASKKDPRKISNTDKGSHLFGTDFFYVDIEKKATKDFIYRYLGEELINGQSLKMIESKPLKKDYPYQKTISWVNDQTHMEMKIAFYQNSQLIKTLQVNQLNTIDSILTVTQASIINHQRQSSTQMTLSNIKYNQNIKNKLFSFKALTAREIRH